jgi:type II secretory pathway predicted ATPase ExeA
MVTNIAKSLPAEITVNQIYRHVARVPLPGLIEEETAAYLQHRLVAAGRAEERLFDVSTPKKIHQTTRGFPGP